MLIWMRRMKLSVQGSLIAHQIGLGPLNKDLQSVWVCSQNFSFYHRKAFFDDASESEKYVKSYISKFSCPISTNLVSNWRKLHQLSILMNSFWFFFQNFEMFNKVKKGLWAGGTFAQFFSKSIEAMSMNLVSN